MKNVYYYIKESLLDDEDEVFDGASDGIIKEFLETNYKIRGSYNIKEAKDGFIVDVKGEVVVANKNIASLTDGLFEFGSIGGDFDCYHCNLLTSLEGAPKEVVGYFNCGYCHKLKSLEGSPQKVVGDYECYHCKSLRSLEGAPKEVAGMFDCSNCDSLKSLEGSPQKVVGGFNCIDCKSLETLEGAPKEIGGSFFCAGCDKLKDLKGAPKKCRMFDCRHCNVQFTAKDVRKYVNNVSHIFV